MGGNCYLEDKWIEENGMNMDLGKISFEDVNTIRILSIGRRRYWWCYTLKFYNWRVSNALVNT
jgi:hypothetical protein